MQIDTRRMGSSFGARTATRLAVVLLAARGPKLPAWGQAALAALWFAPPLIFIVAPVQVFPTVPVLAGLSLAAVFSTRGPEAERAAA